MSDGVSFGTVNVSGDLNNIGKNDISGGQTVNNYHSGSAPTVKEVFKAIEDSVPPEVQEDTIQPLMAMAELPPEVQEEKKEEAKNLWQRLEPYRCQIIKGCAAFSETALTAVAASNPILLGLVALIKAVKPE